MSAAPTFEIDELTSADYSAVLSDSDGNPVPGSMLDSLTLTLYEEQSEAIVNDRDEQDVLNTNDVTVDESGQLLWHIQFDDAAIVNAAPTARVTNDDGDPIEVHCALFRAVWDGGTKAVNHLIRLNVRSYSKLS